MKMSNTKTPNPIAKKKNEEKVITFEEIQENWAAITSASQKKKKKKPSLPKNASTCELKANRTFVGNHYYKGELSGF